MLWYDKLTGICDSQWTASEIQRYAVLPRFEMLAWSLCDLSSSPFISPQSASVLRPNFDTVCTATQRTNTLQESVDVDLFQESTLLPSSLSLLTHFSPPYSIFPLQLFATLGSHPIWVASQWSQITCLFVNRSEVATTASALTRPCYRILTRKCSGPIFLGRLQLESQLVDTS